MAPPPPTPRHLVEALRDRDADARARLHDAIQGPVGRLVERVAARHRLPHDRDRLTLYALRSVETYLRTRTPAAFEGVSWPAFRAAVVVYAAKVVSPLSGGPSGQAAAPEPLPDCPDYDCRTVFLPCERVGDLPVGGDWFGGRRSGDGALWVIVADVTGHGYGAYLLAGGLPHAWRACWDTAPEGCKPADLLGAMHRLLEDCLPEGVYVEATLARLRPDGEVTVAPAGGTRLFLRGRGQRWAELHTLRGTWLGLSPPSPADQRSWALGGEDELVLASDGLFDQLQDAAPGAALGELVPAPEGDATLFDAVHRALRESLRAVPQRDDITMMVLRRRGQPVGAAPALSGAGLRVGEDPR